MGGSGKASREEAPQATTEHGVTVSVSIAISVSASVFVSVSVSQRALMFSAFCVEGPGEDSREEAPQATTEHLVANV